MGKRSRLLEILPNFLLFFLFACCMFFVLLSGAKLYKNVSSENLCSSYILPFQIQTEGLGESGAFFF